MSVTMPATGRPGSGNALAGAPAGASPPAYSAANRPCDGGDASRISARNGHRRGIASLRHGAPLQGLEPTPEQGRVRREVPLDLPRSLVSIHLDPEVAFFAELDGCLRILVRQPAESAGGPNGRVGRCGTDILQGRKHLLTSFPN